MNYLKLYNKLADVQVSENAEMPVWQRLRLTFRIAKCSSAIQEEICKYIDGVKPDKILMEETVLSSNTDTLKKLAYLAGGVMFYAHERGIEFELVLPSQWRKKIGLQQSNKIKREVLKQESIQAVKQEYGLDVTDDEADACLLARSGFDLPKIVITEDDLWS